MKALLIMVGIFAGSTLGWMLGDRFGLGPVASFLLSGVGSLAGVYAGWKLARRLDAV